MDKLKEHFLGYIRVSTLKQIKGTSLDNQRKSITDYCNQRSIKLERVFIDKGLSAYKKRPEFDKLMKRLLNDETISGVVCYDLTRFGRSTIDLLIQINQIEKTGKTFATVHDNFDTSTKSGKLLLTMLSAIAEYERATIQERMEAGREWAKIHGTRSGKPMHRPLIEIDWDSVKEWRKLGLSWNKTAKQLGISTPTLISRAKDERIK